MTTPPQRPHDIESTISYEHMPDPIYVNFVQLFHFQSEVIFIAGHLNVPAASEAVHRARQSGHGIPVKVPSVVSNQMAMSIPVFANFHARVNAMADNLREQGVDLAKLVGPT